MDIKIEPNDELLSSNDRAGIHNVNFNIEGHSAGDRFGVRLKQEVFDDGNDKMEENVFVLDLQKIGQDNKDSWEKYKKEFHEELPPIKVEKIDFGECSYAEWKPDKCISQDCNNIKQEDDLGFQNFKSNVIEDKLPFKGKQINAGECSYVDQTPYQFQNANVHSPRTNKPPLKSSTHDRLLPKIYMEKQLLVKSEILQRGVVAVINLENNVFHKQNFVCGFCFNIFPSSHLLNRHLTYHEKSKFKKEKSGKLGMNIKIELEHKLLPSENNHDIYSHQNNMSNTWNEDHSIDIKYEALADHKKVVDDENHHNSGKIAHPTQTRKLIEMKFNSIAETVLSKTALKKIFTPLNPITFVRLVDYSDSESDTQDTSEVHIESQIEQEDFGGKSCIDLASNSKIVKIYDPHLSAGVGLREPKLAPKRSRKRAEKCTGQHKTVKPNPCLNKKCGNNCALHFSEEDRVNIHAFYWGMASRQRQRNWLLSSIVKQPIKRKRTHHKSRRNQSYKYYINWNNNRIQVCQQFLMKTLDVGQMTIRHTYVNYLENNGSKPDRREKPKKID